MSDEFKNNEQNDELLKKWLKRVHQNVEIPDGTQSWLYVKARLDKIKKRKRWIKQLKISTLVVCTSLLISFIVNTDLPTAYSQFQGLVKKVQENIIDIFFEEPAPPMEENPEARTSAPPPDGFVSTSPREEGRMEDTSLEEARRKVMFPIVSPTYLPAGYELDIVRIYPDSDGEYRTVFMEYVDSEGQIIQLSQRMIREHSSPEKTTVHHDSAIIKDLIVNGCSAVMIIQNPDLIHLEWITADHIKLSIFGVLAEEEITLIAESLQ